jgi:hypothetical protein
MMEEDNPWSIGHDPRMRSRIGNKTEGAAVHMPFRIMHE